VYVAKQRSEKCQLLESPSDASMRTSTNTIRRLLDDSQKTLIPAIRALKGNRAYYVGIDRENNAMTNVSVWDTRRDAEQMASLRAMLDLAKIFVEAGVRFERPITNHETLWTL
jgi:hypothetical protein